MLFVLPSEKGKGYGTSLLNFAFNDKHIRKIDVNEDNKEAYSFYLRRGYRVVGRDEVDTDSKPYPIVHLQKKPLSTKNEIVVIQSVIWLMSVLCNIANFARQR